MGLNDLTNEEPKIERKEEPEKQKIEPVYDENDEYTPKSPGEDVDYDVEEKPCKSCMCISPKEPGSDRYWECPNPECGTIKFTMGWNEWRVGRMFLADVEIEGWRYED